MKEVRAVFTLPRNTQDNYDMICAVLSMDEHRIVCQGYTLPRMPNEKGAPMIFRRLDGQQILTNGTEGGWKLTRIPKPDEEEKAS